MLPPKRPRVILSTYDDISNPHYGGGGAIAMHRLAKELLADYHVTVISWNHSGMREERIEGVTYRRIGVPWVSPKLGMFLFQLLLPFWCMSLSFDLWIESFGPPCTTSFLPWCTKKPVIGVIHMLAAADMKRKYGISTEFLENLGLKQYQTIIATQDSVARKVLSLNPSCDCIVIGNGVDLPRALRSKKKNQIVFLGRIEIDQKGLDLLLASIKKLPTALQESYSIVIAGNGLEEEYQNLQRLVENSGLTMTVELVGRVTGEAKAKILHESICMVVPSRFETFSMAALEALAYGLPVVCFDIDGLHWVPKASANKVKPFQVGAFAAALHQILTRVEVRQQMSIAGKEYAKNFTWEKIMKQYSQTIHDTLSYAK